MRVLQDPQGRTVFVLSRDEILALKNDQSVGGKAVNGNTTVEFVIMRDRHYDRSVKSFQKAVQQAALQAASLKASEGPGTAEQPQVPEPTPTE